MIMSSESSDTDTSSADDSEEDVMSGLSQPGGEDGCNPYRSVLIET